MEDVQVTPVPATPVVTDGQDWPHVAKLLGGKPIKVGPGRGIAINPLDSTSLDEKTIVGPSRSGKAPIGIQHRQFLSRMELEHGLRITVSLMHQDSTIWRPSRRRAKGPFVSPILSPTRRTSPRDAGIRKDLKPWL